MPADPDLVSQSINRMLGAGADVAQSFQQGVLNLTNAWNALATRQSMTHETTTQLITYAGAQALAGTASITTRETLDSRSVRDQPQTTGQQTSAPPYQVSNAPPPVYAADATGKITKVG